MRFLYTMMVWLLGAMFCASSTSAGQTSAESVSRVGMGAAGPYCGVYCLYAAAKLSSKEVSLASLLRPEYISSAQGSSVSELLLAAKDLGLHAQAWEQMNSWTLRSCPYPMILRVRADHSFEDYTHFILFLGMNRESAVLMDPLIGLQEVPLPSLLARWAGTGLVVSGRPLAMSDYVWQGRLWLLMWICIPFVTLWGIGRLATALRQSCECSLRSRFKGIVSSVLILSFLGAAFGGLHHSIRRDGLLATADVQDILSQAHFPHLLQATATTDLEFAIDSGAVLVDARFPRDFEQDHIAAALNIPVFFGKIRRARALQGISKNRRLVVYCQTQACGFAEKVARALWRLRHHFG